MFKISDKVVRVHRIMDNPKYEVFGAPMEVGRVYVVSGVENNVPFKEGDRIGLFLVGCEAYFKPWAQVVPWNASYFRKLEDIKEENRKKQEEPQPV